MLLRANNSALVRFDRFVAKDTVDFRGFGWFWWKVYPDNRHL
jgi:hypothetical protein